jgi:hypothetical protein
MSEHLALPLYKMIIKSDKDSPAIGYGVFDNNGDYLTKSLPESVCDDLVTICNYYFYEKLQQTVTYGKHLCYMNVAVEPMEKPESRIVSKDKHDNLIVVDSPAYVKYMKEFADAFMKSNIPIHTDLPIDCRCQLTAKFYCSTHEGKSLPAYLEALLDCLVYCGIIVNKGHRIINNTDGSRIYYENKEPHISIWLREWSNKKQ